MRPIIAIVSFSAGNTRSIANAFRRLGAEPKLASCPQDLEDADAIILPGVGSFSCIGEITKEFRNALLLQIAAAKPLLGICLGMQWLFEESEESPGVNGLGVFKGKVKRLPPGQLVPHIGWNAAEPVSGCSLLNGCNARDYFYFVHSYVAEPSDRTIIAATTNYEAIFPSIILRKNVFGVQFHPEKSGPAGEKLLKNFLGLISCK